MRAIAVFVALAALPALCGDIATVQVLEHPDVVVTSASHAGEGGSVACSDPCRPFSAKVEVRNEGTTQRDFALWFNAHVDPATGGCDLSRTTPVHLFAKAARVPAGETAVVGGSVSPREGAEAYWPAAIYQRYAGPTEVVDTPAGTHTFCIHLVEQTAGVTDTCPAPCVRSVDRFNAFVRASNEAPWVRFSQDPAAPEPGQAVTFTARLGDNDTVPRPDELVARWDLGNGRTAEGTSVTTTYDVQGEHTVVLSVTDGFDTVQRTSKVVVGVASGPDGPDAEEPRDQPLPWGIAVASALAAALLLRRTM